MELEQQKSDNIEHSRKASSEKQGQKPVVQKKLTDFFQLANNPHSKKEEDLDENKSNSVPKFTPKRSPQKKKRKKIEPAQSVRKKYKRKRYEISEENSGESELSRQLASSAEDANEYSSDELEKIQKKSSKRNDPVQIEEQPIKIYPGKGKDHKTPVLRRSLRKRKEEICNQEKQANSSVIENKKSGKKPQHKIQMSQVLAKKEYYQRVLISAVEGMAQDGPYKFFIVRLVTNERVLIEQSYMDKLFPRKKSEYLQKIVFRLSKSISHRQFTI